MNLIFTIIDIILAAILKPVLWVYFNLIAMPIGAVRYLWADRNNHPVRD